jgi:carboxylesterase type B
VIVVTSNYRLNIFGFLASEELRKRDPEGSTGNYGIQDQRAAMVWFVIGFG